MMISTKGRYALRVMVDLAEHNKEEYIPLKEIADRQEISEKYLESIIKILVQNEVVEGVRGKGGGYRLTKEPQQYMIGDILRMTEGTLAPVACLGKGEVKCKLAASCRTLPMWRKLYSLITDFFDGITIADLMISEQTGNDYII